MTYADIVSRIANNIGLPSQSSVFLSITKKDIYDAISKIYRKVEPIKATYELTISSDETVLTSGTLVTGRRYTITSYQTGDDFTNVGAASNADDVEFTATGTTPTTWTNSSEITPSVQEITLPDDFFVPLEVLFYNSDGLRYPSKELQYEEYMRWNPDIEAESESFGQFDVTSTPAPFLYTRENFDFDGLVGYTFSDSNPQKLLWKPAIGGSLKIYYSNYSTSAISLTSSPDFHAIFHELIVVEVTIRQLIRKLSTLSDTVQSFGLQAEIKHYKDERTELLSNLSGYVNRNVETPTIAPFDFMNDPNMIIFNDNF